MRLLALSLIFIATLFGGNSMAETPKKAIIAGGCFWCVETDMEKLPGVIDVVSGYSGGSRVNPTYENHHDIDAANPVPHVEVVEVTYDPARVDLPRLLIITCAILIQPMAAASFVTVAHPIAR